LLTGTFSVARRGVAVHRAGRTLRRLGHRYLVNKSVTCQPDSVKLGLALIAQSALLATRSEPASFQLSYVVAGGCPDRAAFVAAIEQRLGPTHVDNDATLAIEVEIASALKPTGRLVIRGFGDETPRFATAATCGEVIEALALIAAHALEAAPPAADAMTDADTAEPVETTAKLGTTRPQDDVPFEISSSEPAVDRGRWGLVAMAVAHLTTVPATGSAIGGGATFEVWTDPRATHAYRFTFVRSDNLALSALTSTAWLRWTWARAEGCPLRLGTHIMIKPCVGLTGGVVDSASAASDLIESRTRPWLAIGAGIRAATGGEPWFVSVEAGAVAPLIRDTFVLERSGTAYRLPPVLFSLSAGFGLRFR
jgi:hypothetical protein